MFIEKITRDFLINVAEAATFKMTDDLNMIVANLITAGRYTEATEDEIEAFDVAFDAADDASQFTPQAARRRVGGSIGT